MWLGASWAWRGKFGVYGGLVSGREFGLEKQVRTAQKRKRGGTRRNNVTKHRNVIRNKVWLRGRTNNYSPLVGGSSRCYREFLGAHPRARWTSTNPLGCSYLLSCLPHTNLCHMPMLVPVLGGPDAIMDQASLVGAEITFKSKEQFHYFPKWRESRYFCLNIKHLTKVGGVFKGMAVPTPSVVAEDAVRSGA